MAALLIRNVAPHRGRSFNYVSMSTEAATLMWPVVFDPGLQSLKNLFRE
jgi:hypothetical protein